MKFYNESSSLIFKDLVLGKVGVASPILASSSKKQTTLLGGFIFCFGSDAICFANVLFRHFVPYKSAR